MMIRITRISPSPPPPGRCGGAPSRPTPPQRTVSRTTAIMEPKEPSLSGDLFREIMETKNKKYDQQLKLERLKHNVLVFKMIFIALLLISVGLSTMTGDWVLRGILERQMKKLNSTLNIQMDATHRHAAPADKMSLQGPNNRSLEENEADLREQLTNRRRQETILLAFVAYAIYVAYNVLIMIGTLHENRCLLIVFNVQAVIQMLIGGVLAFNNLSRSCFAWTVLIESRNFLLIIASSYLSSLIKRKYQTIGSTSSLGTLS